MRRRPIILVAVLLVAGCQTLHLKDLVRVQDSDWWTTGGSAAHNSAVSQEIAPPLRQVWEYNALAGFGASSPLVMGNTVIVANLQGELHAIDLETGKRKGQKSFRGEAIHASPALIASRIVVANAWGSRTVHGYDLRGGKSVWHRDLPRVKSGLLAYGDAVLVADMDGGVRLIDELTGDDRWTFEDPDGAAARADPLMAADRFVVIHEDGTARAFDPATGDVAWETELGTPVYASPAASGSMVYVPTTQGKLLAVDARTGRVSWRFDTNNTQLKIASPSIAGDTIYFGSSDGSVRAISTEFGASKWRAKLPGGVSAQVLVAGGYVYVGTMQNRLVALDFETGGEIWSTDLRGRVKSSMAVAGDGILVLTEPRFVNYFRPEASLAPN
ncbi:MAG: outer membrane protein assembly factor BamB [Rhodothermales bacterium]|jgi:outer membrane protein assembly factor BamB